QRLQIEGRKDWPADRRKVTLSVGILEHEEPTETAVRIVEEERQTLRLPDWIRRRNVNELRLARGDRRFGLDDETARRDQVARIARLVLGDRGVQKAHVRRGELGEAHGLCRLIGDVQIEVDRPSRYLVSRFDEVHVEALRGARQ